jgi:hypothetical protein
MYVWVEQLTEFDLLLALKGEDSSVGNPTS